MGIPEFLTARLDEDEAIAQAAADGDSGRWFVGRKWDVYRIEDQTPHEEYETNRLVATVGPRVQSEHIARHDPARTLCEIEAKRAILSACARTAARLDAVVNNPDGSSDADDASAYSARAHMQLVLRLLAVPFAGHPGFDPAWKVED